MPPDELVSMREWLVGAKARMKVCCWHDCNVPRQDLRIGDTYTGWWSPRGDGTDFRRYP